MAVDNKVEFHLIQNGISVPLFIEETAFEGVVRVGEKVANDIELVSGNKVQCLRSLQELSMLQKHTTVLCATCGKSPFLEDLSKKNLINLEEISNKREVFGIKIVQNPFEGVSQALVIYGSDKRGTIYGMFHLSKILGVSPLIYWGDVKPMKQENVVLRKEIEMVSKEPSVRYRGFFINDEWPCFGNWTFEHFGGFTAQMYDKVFELLLRLNGNYLWPAMWTSSFALDGPGMKNVELADLYGIVISNSHHEPCLRASEEWDKVRGEESIYGNEWNYYTNKEGLLRYWEDGLIRGRDYESLITIGMRGERDSSMLGPDATLQENIDLLKDIITQQNKLIKKHVNDDLTKAPRLLALYKEVEAYFYGDEQAHGLKDWEELEDVILMLCEDNMGNMRTLPTKQMRSHRGGYGMYYHFDYHGDPISYEWVNSTPLTKVWEQMTEAYEYGVRDVWIVNVGDLKFNEFPLSYFLNLAYDFETWGTNAPNSTELFTRQWMEQQFAGRITKEQIEQLVQVQTGYVCFNGMRRPEALHSKVYHPVHYGEANRMLAQARQILETTQQLYKSLPENCLDAFYSMIYFPATASMNLLQMHLYAAKNEHYAKQGKKKANDYFEKVTACIELDKQLAKDFATALEGKWNGMQLAQHIGFTKWNEDNCRYPLRMQVEPAYKPRMVVSRADEATIAVKDYFAPMVIEVKEFLYPPYQEVVVEIANDGIGEFTFHIDMEPCPWLTCEVSNDTVSNQETLTLQCKAEHLPKEETLHKIYLSDGDTKAVLHIYGKKMEIGGLPAMCFLPGKDAVVMDAKHYSSINVPSGTQLVELNDFGKWGSGLKAFPLTETFPVEDGPSATYTLWKETEESCVVELRMAPSNPVEKGKGLRCSIKINQGETQVLQTIPQGFQAGVPHNPGWTRGVLDQVRIVKTNQTFRKGINTIQIGFIDPGFVLERLVIYKADEPLKTSYLGPEESYYC